MFEHQEMQSMEVQKVAPLGAAAMQLAVRTSRDMHVLEVHSLNCNRAAHVRHYSQMCT